MSGGDSNLMYMAETIALTHQERWDGSGYPQNLKGEETPLLGRIVAICDVFDALTSKRHYKEAYSVERSMETIEEQKGTGFEPRLVDAFKKTLPEMVEIVNSFADSEETAGEEHLLKIFRSASEKYIDSPLKSISSST